MKQKSHRGLVVLVGLLLAYANGDAVRCMYRPRPLTATFNFQHLAALAACLAWARASRLTFAELGLSPAHSLRSLRWGLAAGLIGTMPVSVFFALPWVSRRPVAQPDLSEIDRRGLARLVFGQFLVSTAVFEEIAFRGLLHGLLQRHAGPRAALIWGSVAFCAWHTVVAWHNLRCARIRWVWFPVAYSAVMAALFTAGVGFGLLRHWTRHVVGSIIAHWLLISAIAIALVRHQRVLRRAADEMAPEQTSPAVSAGD